MSRVLATVANGRRTLGGPDLAVHFHYVRPGLYESDALAPADEGPYRLERLGRSALEGREGTGWYLTGGNHLHEWCASDIAAAVRAANGHITNDLATH
ncbi:hypothetical protein [Streptomyces sp. NPDC088752]|uniref:hypothetical protein n=1 Tax=Streptomyces sp. NPDC088752 TaxID=3154963 RepID=UPI003421BF14